jgi:hypothetical protein
VQHVVWCGSARQYLHASDVATLARDTWVIVIRRSRIAGAPAARARVESAVVAVSPSGAARLVEELLEASALVRIEATAGTSTRCRIRRGCRAEE